jgi:hypothetical protein
LHQMNVKSAFSEWCVGGRSVCEATTWVWEWEVPPLGVQVEESALWVEAGA